MAARQREPVRFAGVHRPPLQKERNSVNKKIVPLILLCILLCGCQAKEKTPAISAPPPEPAPKTAQELLEEQPIDDTHDAFLVDTGGRLGTLLVTAELGTERGEFDVSMELFVWNPMDMSLPFQTIETKTAVFHWSDVADANFDGYQDFGYMYSMGNQPTYWNYWIWNEEMGQFELEPELGGISDPVFKAEAEEIRGWARESAASDGVNTIHKWVDGELVCVRRIEVYKIDGWEGPFALVVEDRIDGELTEVFRTEFPTGSDGYFDERSKWENLDYHGETK